MGSIELRNKRRTGLRVITIDMPVSDSHYIEVAAEIVNVEVPLLLGLDIVKYNSAILNFKNDRPYG